MGNHSIDRVKSRQMDVKKNIENKKGELGQLEERKQSLLEAGIDTQGSDMDESTKRVVMEQLNAALEENAEKGKELSSEMQDDLNSLTEMKEEVSEMREATKQERSKLEGRKSILDIFGGGRNIDSAIQEMDDSTENLDALNGDLLEDERELNEISQRLNSL